MGRFGGRSSGDGKYFAGDEAYVSGIKEIYVVDSVVKASWALYLMLALVLTAILWATFSRVDQIVKSEGKVVSDGKEQVIASLEGGILSNVFVREGMLVEKGQDLVQLDPTRVEAQQNESQAKRVALLATVARLEAESMGRPLHYPPEVRKADASVMQLETESYEARRQALNEAVSVTRRSLGLLQKELRMSQRFAANGLMSDVEVMRLQRQANDLNLQIQERINRFRQDASAELVRTRTDLAQLEEQMVVKKDVLSRTTLKSPVRGVVKAIRIATLGGVVTPGAPIMEILPLGSRVMVEAHIKPADIGFIRKGLPVTIKLSAYDYYLYGGLKGVVDYISPDALVEEGKAASPDSMYYRALVVSEVSTLKQGDKPLPVMPGMIASVEMRTGERTVLQYLLMPMMRTQDAFRER